MTVDKMSDNKIFRNNTVWFVVLALVSFLVSLSSCVTTVAAVSTSSSTTTKNNVEQNDHVQSVVTKTRTTPTRFDGLRDRAMNNPMIPDNLRGKTYNNNDNNNNNIDNSSRHAQEGHNQRNRKAQAVEPSYNFFMVYDEYDPLPLKKLGETAGARGLVYKVEAKESGLTETMISGAFSATCSLVASTGIQLCTYEIFIVQDDYIGTVVATGSLSLQLNKQNLLLIEATGDDYAGYKNGFLGITYIDKNDSYAVDLELLF